VKIVATAMHTKEPAGRTLLAPTPANLPILFEDEEEGDLGEANLHALWTEILHVCLKAHLASRPELQVYLNMNLYYRDTPLHPVTRSRPYVSPDVMVVQPFAPLPESVVSYTIGVDGPAPLLVAEVLSDRSAQQRDLGEKLQIYAGLGVAEYFLADPTGAYIATRLLRKKWSADRIWQDETDPDGGVTSQLGCRFLVDGDGKLTVCDATTGRQYVRPHEAQKRVEELEAELAKLREAKKH
jgi:Uma2 family endonuclease